MFEMMGSGYRSGILVEYGYMICFVTPSMIAPMACSGVMGGLLRYLNSGEDSGMISDVMTELR